MTRGLTRGQLRQCVDLAVLAGELRRAFAGHDDAAVAHRLRARPHPSVTAMVLAPVHSPVGLPLQDCVIAWHAYRRATEGGVGSQVDLEP